MKEKRGKRSELPLFIEDYQTKEWGIRMEGQGINWRSLALDQPPIIENYSAPVLVRIAATEYFTAKFFRYDDGTAAWKVCYDERVVLATVDDFWILTNELEKDFE